MKRLLVVLFALMSVVVSAQIVAPVEWEFSHKKLSDNEIELQFKASILSPWHMYSQFIPSEEDVTATEFTFFNTEGYKLIESVIESGVIEDYDPVNEAILKYFEGEAIFSQKIRVLSQKDFKLEGSIWFGVCDDSRCLAPETIDFSFEINGVVVSVASASGDDLSENNTDEIKGVDISSEEKPSENSANKGMWYLFYMAFGFGFAALLTPCVFPMIPMTVAFFTKQSKTKAQGITNAIIYGFSIIAIYVALGVGVSYVFGAGALNDMATNVYFNIGFFFLLIIFGVSFLGAFDIQLPASWTNKSVEAESRGGVIGIFFMAFTLALVSFSCTGPLVGTLLVQASTGTEGYLGPIIGMLGFSLALALPFALFAAFPGWLNSLPQSGGWLNSVKVTLGFLEIALAFKFLSTADLVMQTHWLERELFLSIWIVIFGLLTIYLLGFLKLPHDSDLKHLSVGRLSVAILAGTLTVYMIPGLWGAPLKLVSGLPPPMQYSESPYGVGNSKSGIAVAVHKEKGQHVGPQEILAFHDYNEGLAYAKKIGKPVFLDFTGHGCQNCRKMEEYVWSDPSIKRALSNDVVLISLYVDERTKLPKEQQYETIVAGKTKKIKTIGDKWKMLQIQRYNSNSQPYYVLLNHDEKEMVEPANYLSYGSVELFADWLNRGLKEFNK
jgi:thiol:disulfide interchange protein